MSSFEIAVVDYGINNIGSVLNMLRRVGADCASVESPRELADKAAIVLPGIGAFDAGVQNLRRTGLFDAIRERVEAGTPILGICLGMQLLSAGSEEGKLPGLGLLAATTRRFVFEPGKRALELPHMGWNETTCVDPALFARLVDARFYYVHSYHVACEDERDVAARCSYGVSFAAAVRRGHVMGTQFHPEKSHRFGMTVLSNFVCLARGADPTAAGASGEASPIG